MPAPTPTPAATRVPRALQAFLEREESSGLLLVGAAVAALAIANSPWHDAYDGFWLTEMRITLGDLTLQEDLRHWINDGLMAIFFFVVGLEVKRELVSGDLRRWRTAALPVIAAAGGMVAPALIYLAFNPGGPEAAGWGVPVATDIAFALAVLSLVGRGAPPALRIFLLTLAVADDIGAIVVIAVFYAGMVHLGWLAAAVALLAAIIGLQRARIHAFGPFIIIGIGVWLATFQSGVHATLAGVALGLITPARPLEPDQVVRAWARDLLEEPQPHDLQRLRQLAKHGESPVERLQAALHPWSSFVIVPLFALANSGVRLLGIDLGPGGTAVALGTGLGLVAGKFVGITGATVLAVRLGVGELPDSVTRRDVAGAAACAGIGFTVSLFIAGLAFRDEALADASKIGILAASAAASAAAAAILWRRASRSN